VPASVPDRPGGLDGPPPEAPDSTPHYQPKLDLQSPIGDTGDHLRRTEHYEVETDVDRDSLTFWNLYESRDPKTLGEMFRGSCGYSGYPDVITFSAARQAENDKQAKVALKHRLEAEAARVRAEAAQRAVDAIRAAFDLSDSTWEWKLWGEVGEAAGQDLPDFLGRELDEARKPEQRKLAIRKLLRPLLSSAKENTREEFPEDYREAEDKDDFYIDYLTDIVGFIVLDVEQPQ
jgi:hypothetical protein